MESEIVMRLTETGLKPPNTVTLAITNQCNLSCRHCWPESGPEENAPLVPIDRVSRLIDDFNSMGTEKFVITGGEPLTHPDWLDILWFAANRSGVKEVRLQTNAILISSAHVDSFLRLKNRGLVIQTSLEGASPASHDRVRGAGSFDLTCRGLHLLVKAGLAASVCITFTEMRHNMEDIPELLRIVDDMGVGEFVTGTLVSGGRAARTSHIDPPTPVQYAKLLACYRDDKDFRARYQRIGNIAALEWFRSENDPVVNCCAFIEKPYVTVEGKLYPCVMLHADDFAATDAYKRPLPAVLSPKIESWSRLQQIKQSRLTHLAACQNCRDYSICGAGCIGRAYSAYGDFYAVEDRCPLRKAIYDHRPSEV
jgi:radical SAM protein with 4Fe4S-binding SPASM domain